MKKGMKEQLTRFDSLYEETFAEIRALISREALSHLARHCQGWHPDRYDMLAYLKRSVVRYRQAYAYILEQFGDRRVDYLDIGGFWGIFPSTLKKLDYPASMTEKYEYYAAGFDGIRDYLDRLGVVVIDADPVLAATDLRASFDVVSCMALLEHLANSPKVLFENFRRLLRNGGGLILEVPNLAYWYKRKALLKGETVLCHIESIYRSEVPFIGHHHEYTRDELEWILNTTGFRIQHFDSHNYSLRPWRQAIINMMPKSFHEVLITFSLKQDLVPSSQPGSAINKFHES